MSASNFQVVAVPTARESEDYRHHQDLLRVLVKIDELCFGKALPPPIDAEYFFAHYLYGKDRDPQDRKADSRREKIGLLREKISLYREKYFTPFDEDDLRAQQYLEQGLEVKLRQTDLDLQTRCLLVLESPRVITVLGCHLFDIVQPPTTGTEMMRYFYEYRYHINANPDGFDWHFLAVRYNHQHMLIKFFTKYAEKRLIDICIDHVAVKGYLPDYVLQFMGLRPDMKFGIRELIQRFPRALVKIYLKILELHVTLCKLSVWQMNPEKRPATVSVDTIWQVICNALIRMKPNMYTQEGIQQLIFVYRMLKVPWFLEMTYQKRSLISSSDSNFIARLVLARMRSLPNSMARISRIWKSQQPQEILDVYREFDSVMELHDLRVLTGGQFNYQKLSKRLLCSEIDPDYVRDHHPRVLLNLQKLDALATRHGQGLDFSPLLALAAQVHCESICRWILDLMTQRQYKIGIYKILIKYIGRLEFVDESEIDFPWLTNLLAPYKDLCSFDGVDQFLSLMKGERAEWDYASYNTITDSLIWLEDVMAASGQEIDYVDMFGQIEGYDVSPQRKERIERDLLILLWVDTRIKAFGQRTPYQVLIEGGKTIINKWAIQQLEIADHINKISSRNFRL